MQQERIVVDQPIKVTFSALQIARADTRNAAVQLNAQLDELKRYLAPLVASWEGEAAERYLALQSRWDDNAADITNVLDTISQALGSAGHRYQQGETANAARWA